VQVAVIVVFTAFISDFRKKGGMVPLMKKELILLLKLLYLAPLIAYGYVLHTMRSVFVSDFVALALTLLGTILVAKARVDLGTHHVWTGYFLETKTLVTTGVYAFLRHPLYTGICLFIWGGLITVVSRAPWLLNVIVLASVSYIQAFLCVAAAKETRILEQEHGHQFITYRSEVHAFLPRRLFKVVRRVRNKRT